MKPILFPEQETAFDTNGIGVLSDTISCYVDWETNGKFELELRYPIMGRYFADITDRAIILASVDPLSRTQPFRVYRRLPASGGVATIYARHVAYDLLGVPVSPCSATSVAAALNSLKTNAAAPCPFTLTTDKSTAGAWSLSVPKPLWRCLGGEAGSILDIYGGEYEFDRFDVILHNRRGADRGVSVRYGKNLTTLEQDANCANCYTGVYPYWADTEGNLVELPEKTLAADGTYSYVKILTLDCSIQWEEAPTVDQLRAYATSYMNANKIGVPDVSWKIEFVNLEQTEEYKGRALLERIAPGDSVSVVFPALNVDATARATAARWDVLMDRYVYVNLGSVKSNLAKTIAQQQAEIERKPSVSLVQAITMKLTAAILGAKGGAVRLLDTDGDGMPDTLYVADNPNPELAKKVWRWNYEGWAGSKSGYNGPFTVGATLEDGLLATAVTAAALVSGTITSADDGKTFFLDLDNGVLRMNATELTINGESVSAVAIAKMEQTDLFNKLTNNGTIKGIYMKDGQLYINATYMATGILSSVDGETFYLDLDKGILKMRATELSISGKSVSQIASESISVGGRNLLQKKWLKSFSAADSGDITEKYVSSGGMSYSRAAQQNGGFYVTYYPAMEPSTEYTVRFKARGISGAVTTLYVHGSLPDNTESSTVYMDGCAIGGVNNTLTADLSDGAWHEFQIHFKTRNSILSDTYVGHIIQFNKLIETAFSVELTELKWEKGNKATDWSPAPEDQADYADDAAQAAAEAAVDDFSTQENIFNALTNNGETQGIYLKDGKIYINMEYLSSGQITADKFTLMGLFEIYGVMANGTTFLGGYIGYKGGDLGNGIVTDGVMLAGSNMSYHAIATGSGVRLQALDKDFHVTKDHAVCNAPLVINGDVQVNGNVTYTGTLTQQT